MMTLIRKEISGLRPFVWLAIGIAALATVYTLATSFPDKERFNLAEITKDSATGVYLMLLGLVMCTAVLVRENDEGTLTFLDGLPVSRTRVFIGKAVAAHLVLLLAAMLELSLEIGFGWLSRTSVDDPLPWAWIGVIVASYFFLSAYVLALVLALSFLRHWLILVSGLIFWAFVWLSGKGEKWHEWLNPNALVSGLSVAGAPYPWQMLALQAALGTGALLAAWALFCGMGSRSQDSLEAVRGWRAGRIVVRSLRFAAPLAWILAIVALIQQSSHDDRNDQGRPLGESVFAQHQTAYYDFLFREGQREGAKELFASADRIYAEVYAYLDVDEVERIVVDLASPVVSHAAAMTNWTKVRLPLNPDASLRRLQQILAHETAHVLIHKLAGEGFINAHGSTRFFNEGFAQYLDHTLYFLNEDEREGEPKVVAGAISRGAIPFEMLCDTDRLGAERDPELVYQLGAVFCRALIETEGADAPGRVLREFRRSGLSTKLRGAALWRAVIEACDMNFEGVVSAYDERLRGTLEKERDFIASIPRLQADVSVIGSEIAITPKFEGTAPGKVICRIDRSMVIGSEPEHYRPGEDGVIRIPRDAVSGTSVRYLLGWRIEGLQWPVFEPWRESRL